MITLWEGSAVKIHYGKFLNVALVHNLVPQRLFRNIFWVNTFELFQKVHNWLFQLNMSNFHWEFWTLLPKTINFTPQTMNSLKAPKAKLKATSIPVFHLEQLSCNFHSSQLYSHEQFSFNVHTRCAMRHNRDPHGSKKSTGKFHAVTQLTAAHKKSVFK